MESIEDIIEEVKIQICDNFCKWPGAPIPEGKDENWLWDDDSPCNDCPLNRLRGANEPNQKG